MKRNNTILTLCGLLIVADGLCFWETLNAWPNLTLPLAVSVVTGQILTALLLSWMVFVVVKLAERCNKLKFVGHGTKAAQKYSARPIVTGR